jgi:hypothetical protein
VDQRCDVCGTYDRHPRHVHNGGDGSVMYRHMDCCDQGGCPDAGICGTVLRASRRAHGDTLIAWLEGRMANIGEGLTAWLKAGAPMMGGASGLDSNRVVDYLNVVVGYSAPGAGTAVLASGFTAGASNQGHIRLMTVVGSSTVNGTELAGGSYVAHTGIVYSTGTSGSFSTAAYSSGSGTIQNNTTLSQAGMPAATTAGLEIWDSAATPLRWAWGSLASAITTNNGDTLSFAAAAILAALAA